MLVEWPDHLSAAVRTYASALGPPSSTSTVASLRSLLFKVHPGGQEVVTALIEVAEDPRVPWDELDVALKAFPALQGVTFSFYEVGGVVSGEDRLSLWMALAESLPQVYKKGLLGLVFEEEECEKCQYDPEAAVAPVHA